MLLVSLHNELNFCLRDVGNYHEAQTAEFSLSTDATVYNVATAG